MACQSLVNDSDLGSEQSLTILSALNNGEMCHLVKEHMPKSAHISQVLLPWFVVVESFLLCIKRQQAARIVIYEEGRAKHNLWSVLISHICQEGTIILAGNTIVIDNFVAAHFDSVTPYPVEEKQGPPRRCIVEHSCFEKVRMTAIAQTIICYSPRINGLLFLSKVSSLSSPKKRFSSTPRFSSIGTWSRSV
jgi:hypothetical protein